MKPVEEPKPVEEVKPVEEPKPVEEVKPAEVPKPVEEVKPMEEPKPVEEVKPAEQAKPVEEVKPTEQPKVVEEAKPVEQPKPTEAVKPVEEPKPVEKDKPAEEPKQAAEVKPVEPQKQAEEIKPAEQPAPPVAEQKPEPKQGTNWTSQVTQGVKTEQAGAAPASYQSNLPTYQYRYSSDKRGRGKWYAGIIEAGYGLGVGEYGIDNFRINFINGFRIGKTFSAGLGLGVRRYYVEQEKFVEHSLVSSKVQIPVFLDLRKTFSTNTVTPYIALGIGNAARYSATADTTGSVNEGLLFNPSGGIWFNISSRFAVFCGVAYEMQKMEYILLSDDTHFKKNTSSVSLNVGIAF